MVAIFTGLGAGLTRSSASSLGAMGLLGSATLGRGGENVSVNAATGNLLISRRDEFLTGRGLDVGIDRTYNSLAQTSDRDNNDRWQIGAVRRVLGLTGLLNVPGSTVQRLGGDGSLVTYSYGTRNGVSAYWSTAGDGAHEKLVRNGGDWVWTDGASQVTETYGACAATLGEWRIVSQTDISGQSLSFTYQTNSDLLQAVATANGESIQFTWSTGTNAQILTATINGTAAPTRYSYDGNGRLSSVTTDLTPDDYSIADGNVYTTSYVYGSNGLLQTITQTDGSRIDVVYDGSNRVVSLTQAASPGVTRVTALTYGSGYTEVQGPDGRVTRLDYDGGGQLTKITAPPAYTGAPPQVVEFTYDADGNVGSVKGADGNVTTYTYDAAGNQLVAIDPNGNTVRRWYDAGNRVTAERTYGTDGAPQYTRYAYDGAGRVRYVVSPDGRVTENQYDANGLLLVQVDYPEHAYTAAYVEGTALSVGAMDSWRDGLADRRSVHNRAFAYDVRGNATTVTDWRSADTAGQPDVNGAFTRSYFSYDDEGRLISHHSEGELSETFVYDGLDRLVASVDLNGGTTSVVFNDGAMQTVITTAGGYTTTQTYNLAGDLLSSTGSGAYDVGGTVQHKYDKLGRVRMTTDATGLKTYFVYDYAGRMVGKVDDHGGMVEFAYDAANRVIAETHYVFNLGTEGLGYPAALLAQLADPDNTLDMATLRPIAHGYDLHFWKVYDDGGRVIQSIDGIGGVVAYEYDSSDRVIRTTSYVTKVAVAPLIASPPTDPVAVTTGAADTVSRSFYDKDGHLIGTLDGEGYLVEHVYDQAGQKIADIAYATRTASTYWANGTFAQLRSSAGTVARRTHYAYEGGLLRFQVDALGQATEYGYDSAGKLTETRMYATAIAPADFAVASIRGAVTASAADRVTTNTYDGGGRVATSTDASGTVTTYGYDDRGNATRVQVGTGASARVTRNWYSAGDLLRFSVDAEGYVRGYEYDANGQTIRIVTWDAPIGVSDTTTIAQVGSLVTGTWSAKRYGYYIDGQLNLSFDADDVMTVYWYAANGKVRQIYEAWGTPDVRFFEYQYDGAGNLQWEIAPVAGVDTAIALYLYDGLGNRTSMKDARDNWTNYTYDEVGQLKTVTDAAGGVTTYSYNAFGQVVEVIDPRGAVTTTSYDDVGRIASVTDALGYVTTYTYTAFGEVATVTRAGATTSFEYDKLGRVTRSTDAMGWYETYGYDALGNRTSVRNKLGGVTSYGYDRRGLLISETLPISSIDTTGATIAATVTNTYAYDARGNRIAMIEAAGLPEQRATSYVYDRNDRLIETVGPTFLGITPHSYVTHDARGNVTSRTDPTGARTVYFIDAADRVSVEISAVGTYTAYEYDPNGNVVLTRVYATPVPVPADGGAKYEAPAAPGGACRDVRFTYDALNRMTASTTFINEGGIYDGTGWTDAITTTYRYDADGNVVSVIDADGNATLSWYDLSGRKTHQVDGEGYVTTWTYDAEGRVLTETRFVSRAVGSDPSGPPPAVAASAGDRITSFTYDLVGNRLSETRANVLVHDGAGGHTSVNATVSYLYNGLGEVTRKTEATGDQVNYGYDAGGRLTVEERAAFLDYSGASVTPTVDYYYDGLGNLARTRARGSATAADRITTYGYSGGMLAWMADAEYQDGVVADGKRTEYTYDAAGRTTWTRYQRYDASGALIGYEADAAAFDAAGRMTAAWKAHHNGTTWAAVGPISYMAYNSYGEVVTVAAGDGVNPAVVQQQNVYDAAGRVIATTAGDGVWKYYGYDLNGNQTVAIASAGDDLTGLSYPAVLGLVGSDGINATYTAYDRRNMAITVSEEGRHLSTTDAAQTLTTTRAYNAFGEVASETNAAGATIDYHYTTAGRLIRTESPAVSITLEDGTKTTVRPTEHMYYDAGGRLVASRDANGNLTRQTLLAGTGYGGGQALVTSTLQADGGVRQTGYDVHGDARKLTDELGYVTLQEFDKLGRLVVRQALRDPGTAADDHVDTYGWDGLGQQVRHGASWTLQYNAALDYELTNYDALGRVTTSVAFGGDITTISYAWNGGIATAGLGTFGGWVKTTTMANGRVATMTMDMFDRVTDKVDLGGNATTYSYDVAGRMVGSMMTNYFTTNIWLNSGKLGGLSLTTQQAGNPTDNWTRDDALYGYDLAGNRILERLDRTISGDAGAPGGPPPAEDPYNPGPYYPGGDGGGDGGWYPYVNQARGAGGGQTSSVAVTTRSIKNQTASYDALGRLTSWAEAGTDYAPAASLAYEYDAAGNIRRTNSTFATFDANGTATPSARDYWFRFDSMNRVVVDQGELAGGVITGGAAGREIAYDVAGRRVSVTSGGTTELYGYDAASRLTQITTRAAGTTGAGTLRSMFGYDTAGRQVSQQDYDASGTNVVFNRTATYNAKGQLAGDASYSVKTDGKTYSSSTAYYYGEGTPAYALGAVVSQTTTGSVSGTSGSTTATTGYDYMWFDGAQQSHINYSDGTNSWNTYLAYDGASRLRVAEIQDGKPRYVDYVSDELGQVVYRREIGGVSGQTGGPHEVTYRFGGRQLGFTGNNGTGELNVEASIADRQQVTPTNQGTFRNKQVTGYSYADFAQSYDPLNSFTQGSTAGGYTVQAGDTLQGIAYQLWGDGALWYKLAEANGLSMASPLIAGQQLTLPAGVVRTAYNAATMRPYDPADALGNLVPDTSPTPAPVANKKSSKCGVFGAILLAVVAIAVAVALPQALPAVFGGPIGGIGAVVAGNVVSQGVGVATGIQEKFSFKGVALAALSAGVAAGIGQVVGSGALAGSQLLGDVARGALGSAITQGIATATGLQDKFDWAGVAAAGVGAGVGGALARSIRKAGLGTFGARVATVSAIAITDAATRSAIEGSSFGKNLLDAVPNAIGQILGGAIGDALGKVFEGARTRQALEQTKADPKTGTSRAPLADASLPVAPIEPGAYLDALDALDALDLGGGAARAMAGAGVGPASGAAASDATSPDVVVTADRDLGRQLRGLSTTVFKREYLPQVNQWIAEQDAYAERTGYTYDLLSDERSLASSLNMQGSFAIPLGYIRRGGDTVVASVASIAANVGAAYRSVAPYIGTGYLASARAGSSDPRATRMGDALATVARYTVGPGTLIDTFINKPFYAALDVVEQTGLTDPGVIMSLEQSVYGAPLGATLSGVRTLRLLRAESMAADSVPAGYTRAYRAVSHAEFDDIVATGRFNQGPNSLEGKWFADHYENVLKHGDGLEGAGNYRVVVADLPDNAPSLYRVPNLDGRGPARFLHMDDLQGVTPKPYKPR